MPPGSQSNTNRSVSYSYAGKSILNEPISVKLQRDVDLYTRKLEQEKRLFC